MAEKAEGPENLRRAEANEMERRTHPRVVAANGVSRIPHGSPDDTPYEAAANAVIDLVMCVRCIQPNRALGLADRFIGVGEWGFAMEEIAACLKDDKPFNDAFIAAAFERADALLPADAEGDRS